MYFLICVFSSPKTHYDRVTTSAFKRISVRWFTFDSRDTSVCIVHSTVTESHSTFESTNI